MKKLMLLLILIMSFSFSYSQKEEKPKESYKFMYVSKDEISTKEFNRLNKKYINSRKIAKNLSYVTLASGFGIGVASLIDANDEDAKNIGIISCGVICGASAIGALVSIIVSENAHFKIHKNSIIYTF